MAVAALSGAAHVGDGALSHILSHGFAFASHSCASEAQSDGFAILCVGFHLCHHCKVVVAFNQVEVAVHGNVAAFHCGFAKWGRGLKFGVVAKAVNAHLLNVFHIA